MKRLLIKLKNQMDRILELSKKIEKVRGKVKEFKLDKKLKEKLNHKPQYTIPESITREKVYGIAPPKPIRSNPGISVYHDIQIENVVYDRKDPLGLVNKSSPPTPIHLWFINTTLYWAQWRVKIKVESPFSEKIFDYKNQNVLRPAYERSKIYLHKPLPYKRNFENYNPSFPLIIISLRPFGISY